MTDNFELEGKKAIFTEVEYQEYLISTINEMYPKYTQKRLLKDLEKQHIIKLKKNTIQSADDSVIDLSEVEEEEQLTKGISSGNSAIHRQFEKYEFLKSYKYAAIFSVNSVDESLFKQSQDDGLIQNFIAEDYSFDEIYNGVNYRNIKPTMYAMGNVIALKFSRLLTGFTPGIGEKKQIKYPILCVYLKNLEVVEVRFDRVKTYFQEDEFFYHKQVDFVLSWLKKCVGFEIENINISSIINYINKQEQDEVNVYSQAMSTASGGKAVLEAGLNENFILPLLGELKELIKSHEDLFNKSPEIKQLLDMFISETEANSDLPWISLVWKGKEKGKETHVKFRHNFMNQGYTLLQYYGHQSDMEKMDHVTEYIINCKKKLDEKAEDGEIRDAVVSV
ncbi:hypothetical protein [Paenibacillus popilliae]|nr:hypothetical protein [Paenibacillus popilliae]